jgi:hypothetical protein
MTNITDKVKDKLKDAKDKVTSTTKEGVEATKDKMTDAKDKVTSTTKEDRPGTEVGRKDDPLTEYREKEPMTPAKIKEHEPTAVKREMTEHIVESGKEVPNPEAAQERARRSGMAKGTAGSAETATEYEQGGAGKNQ